MLEDHVRRAAEADAARVEVVVRGVDVGDVDLEGGLVA